MVYSVQKTKYLNEIKCSIIKISHHIMVLLKFDDIPLSVIVVRKFFKKILNVSFLYFSRL